MSDLNDSNSQLTATSTLADRVQWAHHLVLQGKTNEARALFYAAEIQEAEWERCLHLGQFLLETGHASEAIESLSIVLDYAHQQQENRLRSTVCHNLAIAYRKLRYFDLAAQFQQYSISWGDLRSANHLTLEQEVDQLSDDAACDLTGRANDAILQQDYELAEQLLNISLTREILYGDLDAQAADWGNLGILHGLQGQNRRAITCLWKAYLLHKQTSNLSAMGHDLAHLAELFWVLGRLQRATRCLSRSISCFTLSDQTTEAQTASVRLNELKRLLRVKEHDPLLN